MKAPVDVFRLALRSAVDAGYLTTVQAGEIARKIDVNVSDLPGREPLNVQILPDVWPMIFLELLSLANNETELPRVAWQEAQRRIAAMKIEELMRVHERLQDEFEKKNARLALLLASGALALSAWRVSFWHIVKRLLLSQAALGTRKVPSDLSRVIESIMREVDYVQRFADAIFAGRAAEKAGVKPQRKPPSSEKAIRSRGDLYNNKEINLLHIYISFK